MRRARHTQVTLAPPPRKKVARPTLRLVRSMMGTLLNISAYR